MTKVMTREGIDPALQRISIPAEPLRRRFVSSSCFFMYLCSVVRFRFILRILGYDISFYARGVQSRNRRNRVDYQTNRPRSFYISIFLITALCYIYFHNLNCTLQDKFFLTCQNSSQRQ